jgi:hypothetical protein
MNLEYKFKNLVHFQPKASCNSQDFTHENICKTHQCQNCYENANYRIELHFNPALLIINNYRTPSSMTINQGIHKMLFYNQNLTLAYQACLTSKCYPYNMWAY